MHGDGYLDVKSTDDGGGRAVVDPDDRTSSAVDDPGGPMRGPGPPPRAHVRPVEGDAGNAYGSLAPTYGQVVPALGSGSTNPEYAHLEQHDAAYSSLVPVYGQVAPHAPGTTDYSRIRPGGGDAAAW